MHGSSERLREREGSGLLCIACSYDLSATIEVGIEKCPECGWHIDVAAIDRQSDPVTYVAKKRWYLPLGVFSPTVWTLAMFVVSAAAAAAAKSPHFTRLNVFQVSFGAGLLCSALWGWNQTAWAKESPWLRIGSAAAATGLAVFINAAALFVVAFLLALLGTILSSP